MNKKTPSPMPDNWLFLLLIAFGALCFSIVLSMFAGCTTAPWGLTWRLWTLLGIVTSLIVLGHVLRR